jgi:hypothetical protein
MVQLALAGARTSAGQVIEMSQSLQIEPDAASRIAPDADGQLVAVSHRLGKLLRAFHSVLESVTGLPIAPVVPSNHRRSGIASRLYALPRPRWFLRYFVVLHIHSMLGALDRRYSARAALGLASRADDHDRRAIQEFRQGLPPVHTKGLLTALLVLVVLLSQPLLETFAEVLSTLGNGAQAMVTVSTDVSSEVRDRGVRAPAVATVGPGTRRLMEELKGSVSSSISGTSIADAMATLTKAGMRDLLLVLVGLVLALYAILRPITSGFRLKRMLFNLHPDFDRHRRRVPVRWHASRSTGIYRLESALLDELGGPPHREVPLDLIVSAIGLIPLLWVIGVILEIGASTPGLGFMALQYAVLFIALVGVRAHWLLTTWRQRSAMTDVAAPGWVRIRGGTAVAEVRNPFTSGLLTLFVVNFSLVPQLGVIGWYRVNRELRDLGYAHGSARLGHFPALSAMAYVMGTSVLYLGVLLLVVIAYAPAWLAWQMGFLLVVSWVAFSVTVYRTHRRVRRAYRASVPAARSRRRGLRPAVLSGAAALLFLLGALVAPLLVWGSPAAALYFGFLQARLNKTWARQGTPMVAAAQF